MGQLRLVLLPMLLLELNFPVWVPLGVRCATNTDGGGSRLCENSTDVLHPHVTHLITHNQQECLTRVIGVYRGDGTVFLQGEGITPA